MTGEVETLEADEVRRGKAEIRKQALARRNKLSPEERRRASLLLADRVIGHQWFYRAGRLLGFASFGTEIDTREILLEALRKNKEVYLPRVEGEEMNFYRVFSLEELQPGYHGIPEPGEDALKYLDWEDCERTLMLMPGVAFDPFRNRIGYGKGYYDRYLADKAALRLRTIAVGFQCQRVEEIPGEARDIRPYQVILV